jgi:hypothetical protein
MPRREGMDRVRRSEPCEICGGTDWCARLTQYHWCMRVESTKPHKKGGWLHPRDQSAVLRPPKPRPPEKTDAQLRDYWTKRAMACHERALDDRKLPLLASQLGVDTTALIRLQVGYGAFDGRKAWTFPERNGDGWIIGLGLRLLEPAGGKNKVRAKGSRAGLIYATDWHKDTGTVWLVEGPSDVAAALTMGVCAIGRPSNVGGVALLASLLAKHPSLKLAVMGERDQKAIAEVARKNPSHNPQCFFCQQCFPGLYGARYTSIELRFALGDGRAIPYYLAPLGYKDLRDFAKSLNRSELKLYGKTLQGGTVPCTVECSAP